MAKDLATRTALAKRDALARPSPSVRPAVLMSFVQQLVRLTPSSAVIWLALRATQGATGATEAELATLRAAIHQEHKAGTPWPKGFFADDF